MNKGCEVFSLEGKVILVTGGTQRYGHSFCNALGEAGGTVILTSRDKKRADEVAEGFRAKGLTVEGRSLEQGSDESIEELVSGVVRDHKRIDVLVNCARTIRGMPAAQITREELDRLFSVNAVGLILLTRRVAEEMKKTGGGNIINVGSIYGMGGQYPSIYREPEKNLALDYPIQKGGAVTYTKQLATTLAEHNIRCNCISLGGLEEPGLDPYFLERYCERTPLGRMANPDDVKGPIIFLASDSSRYMTGVNLMVDGGWTAW